jgi:hypothetical protein
VMVAEGWSEAKKRAYVIADNKLALNATRTPGPSSGLPSRTASSRRCGVGTKRSGQSTSWRLSHAATRLAFGPTSSGRSRTAIGTS